MTTLNVVCHTGTSLSQFSKLSAAVGCVNGMLAMFMFLSQMFYHLLISLLMLVCAAGQGQFAADPELIPYSKVQVYLLNTTVDI